MKPLSIEHLMDNEVQTLSGGARARANACTPRRWAGHEGRGLHRAGLACPALCCVLSRRPSSKAAQRATPPVPARAHLCPPVPPPPPPPPPARAGELQRVAICLCLGQPANVYLIDEPSAYLDSEQRILAAKVIKR